MLGMSEKPHRNRRCVGTVSSVSDAVRPSRAKIRLSALTPPPRPASYGSPTKLVRTEIPDPGKTVDECCATRTPLTKKPLCCNQPERMKERFELQKHRLPQAR